MKETTSTNKMSRKKEDRLNHKSNAQMSKKKMMLQKRNKSILVVIYIFSGLLFLTMGYFSYYMVAMSGDVVNNSYNNRQSILSKRVIRGEIRSYDGEVLAQTLVNDQGEEERDYPYGSTFSNVIGRIGKGVSGVEEVENIRLLTSTISPFDQFQLELADEKMKGNSVVTTLDVQLQQVAYDALGNHRGSVVVLEVRTGKILAMVSKPTFDPNTIEDEWEALLEDKEEESTLINRATQGLYTPGSTFKLITTLAYMRQNPDYAEFEHICTGDIEYKGMIIRCYNNKVHGKVDLASALAYSCNTAFAAIGMELDAELLSTMANGMVFNGDLPFHLASNQSRFTLTKDQGVKAAMQTAMGQGETLMTPLHNGLITAAIANHGVMMEPYLVDRIENMNGRVIKGYTTKEYGTLMTKEEADYLKKMMRAVVTEGTGNKLNGLEVPVAGKTGSADQEGKKAHAWFVGFAPLEQAEIVVSVIVENVGTGSEYAVPIAKDLFHAYFNK